MATRKSVRSAHSRHTVRCGAFAEVALHSERVSIDDALITQIGWLSLRLEIIHRAAMSAQLVLEHHSDGHDIDIAAGLLVGVRDPNGRQFRLAESILRKLDVALPYGNDGGNSNCESPHRYHEIQPRTRHLHPCLQGKTPATDHPLRRAFHHSRLSFPGKALTADYWIHTDQLAQGASASVPKIRRVPAAKGDAMDPNF
jgi:hypothetical protein